MAARSLNSKLIELGVSKSYASLLASGRRTPSPALAIKIYTALGVKLGPVANLTAAEIRTLERLSTRSNTGASA